jgi:toxin-antitoxin system PIN domain toxin
VIALLDVNVLVALAWPNHVHHRAARRWFRPQQSLGWATCPVTQNGFIRVSSNRSIIPEARTPQEAAILLRSMISLAGHSFWSDDSSLLGEKWIPLDRIATHRQVTDAHLLVLALCRGGRLASFDRGISRLLPPGIVPDQVLQLIPF